MIPIDNFENEKKKSTKKMKICQNVVHCENHKKWKKYLLTVDGVVGSCVENINITEISAARNGTVKSFARNFPKSGRSFFPPIF